MSCRQFLQDGRKKNGYVGLYSKGDKIDPIGKITGSQSKLLSP